MADAGLGEVHSLRRLGESAAGDGFQKYLIFGNTHGAPRFEEHYTIQVLMFSRIKMRFTKPILPAMMKPRFIQTVLLLFFSMRNTTSKQHRQRVGNAAGAVLFTSPPARPVVLPPYSSTENNSPSSDRTSSIGILAPSCMIIVCSKSSIFLTAPTVVTYAPPAFLSSGSK